MPAVLLATGAAAALVGAGWAGWLGADGPPGTAFGVWGVVTLLAWAPGALLALARGADPPPLGRCLFAVGVGAAMLGGGTFLAARFTPWVAWSTPGLALLAGLVAVRVMRFRWGLLQHLGWAGALGALAALAWVGRPGNTSAVANALGDIPLLLAAAGLGGLLAAGLVWRRRGHWVAMLLAATILVPAGLGVRTFVQRYDSVAYTLNLARSRLIERGVRLVQPFFDADGDGYARILGGHDCADDNPEVHPNAPEIPANGVDDDCFEGDAPLPPEPEPEPEPEPIPELVIEAPGEPDRPHLVLITIDTIRADRMGYAGYERPTTPNLDRLADHALTFEWAFSQGPQTRMSMPSVFTGRYMSEVARTPELWSRIHKSNVMVAERLRDIGYRTAGFPSHRYFLRSYGLAQGFDHYDLSVVSEHGTKIPMRITGGEITDRALAWLAEHGPGEPFFLWIHYFDPHHFYKDHKGVDFGRDTYDRYDEEIWFTDQQIGRLLDGLAELDRETFIIVHGDHAESVGEHNYTYHGQTLLNDQVHTPLLVAGPGIPGKRVATPVSNIDVVPTLLDLAQQPIPPALRGRSLLEFAHGDPEWKPVLVEMIEDPGHAPRKALVVWPWKIHWMVKQGYYRLHDLSADPKELRNVVLKRKDVFKTLRKRIRRFVAEEVEPVEPHW